MTMRWYASLFVFIGAEKVEISSIPFKKRKNPGLVIPSQLRSENISSNSSIVSKHHSDLTKQNIQLEIQSPSRYVDAAESTKNGKGYKFLRLFSRSRKRDCDGSGTDPRKLTRKLTTHTFSEDFSKETAKKAMQHGIKKDETSCGFLLPFQQKTLQCNRAAHQSCEDVTQLSKYCPSHCPYVDPDPFFPCIAKCVTLSKCEHPVGSSLSFANTTTHMCQPCEVVGCKVCDPVQQGKCLECTKPVFKLLDNGLCRYTLEINYGQYFVDFILFAVVLLLPTTCMKLWRPVARPFIQQAIKNHIHRCKPNVIKTIYLGGGYHQTYQQTGYYHQPGGSPIYPHGYGSGPALTYYGHQNSSSGEFGTHFLRQSAYNIGQEGRHYSSHYNHLQETYQLEGRHYSPNTMREIINPSLLRNDYQRHAATNIGYGMTKQEYDKFVLVSSTEAGQEFHFTDAPSTSTSTYEQGKIIHHPQDFIDLDNYDESNEFDNNGILAISASSTEKETMLETSTEHYNSLRNTANYNTVGSIGGLRNYTHSSNNTDISNLDDTQRTVRINDFVNDRLEDVQSLNSDGSTTYTIPIEARGFQGFQDAQESCIEGSHSTPIEGFHREGYTNQDIARYDSNTSMNTMNTSLTLGKMFDKRTRIHQPHQSGGDREPASSVHQTERAYTALQLSTPHYWLTNVHTDYICGVGLALYYNWLVFLGVWALVVCVLLYCVKISSDFAFLVTDPKKCPRLDFEARNQGLSLYNREAGRLLARTRDYPEGLLDNYLVAGKIDHHSVDHKIAHEVHVDQDRMLASKFLTKNRVWSSTLSDYGLDLFEESLSDFSTNLMDNSSLGSSLLSDDFATREEHEEESGFESSTSTSASSLLPLTEEESEEHAYEELNHAPDNSMTPSAESFLTQVIGIPKRFVQPDKEDGSFMKSKLSKIEEKTYTNAEDSDQDNGHTGEDVDLENLPSINNNTFVHGGFSLGMGGEKSAVIGLAPSTAVHNAVQNLNLSHIMESKSHPSSTSVSIPSTTASSMDNSPIAVGSVQKFNVVVNPEIESHLERIKKWRKKLEDEESFLPVSSVNFVVNEDLDRRLDNSADDYDITQHVHFLDEESLLSEDKRLLSEDKSVDAQDLVSDLKGLVSKKVIRDSKQGYKWVKRSFDPDTYFKRTPNVAGSLEAQRFHFARTTYEISFLLFVITFVMSLWFAFYQKRQHTRFDLQHANVCDYGVIIRGLPKNVTSDQVLMDWLRKKTKSWHPHSVDVIQLNDSQGSLNADGSGATLNGGIGGNNSGSSGSNLHPGNLGNQHGGMHAGMHGGIHASNQQIAINAIGGRGTSTIVNRNGKNPHSTKYEPGQLYEGKEIVWKSGNEIGVYTGSHLIHISIAFDFNPNYVLKESGCTFRECAERLLAREDRESLFEVFINEQAKLRHDIILQLQDTQISKEASLDKIRKRMSTMIHPRNFVPSFFLPGSKDNVRVGFENDPKLKSAFHQYVESASSTAQPEESGNAVSPRSAATAAAGKGLYPSTSSPNIAARNLIDSPTSPSQPNSEQPNSEPMMDSPGLSPTGMKYFTSQKSSPFILGGSPSVYNSPGDRRFGSAYSNYNSTYGQRESVFEESFMAKASAFFFGRLSGTGGGATGGLPAGHHSAFLKESRKVYTLKDYSLPSKRWYFWDYFLCHMTKFTKELWEQTKYYDPPDSELLVDQVISNVGTAPSSEINTARSKTDGTDGSTTSGGKPLTPEHMMRQTAITSVGAGGRLSTIYDEDSHDVMSTPVGTHRSQDTSAKASSTVREANGQSGNKKTPPKDRKDKDTEKTQTFKQSSIKKDTKKSKRVTVSKENVKDHDPLQRFVDVGLVASAFTHDESEEIISELSKMQSSGTAFLCCTREADVDSTIACLKEQQEIIRERMRKEKVRRIERGGEALMRGLDLGGVVSGGDLQKTKKAQSSSSELNKKLKKDMQTDDFETPRSDKPNPNVRISRQEISSQNLAGVEFELSEGSRSRENTARDSGKSSRENTARESTEETIVPERPERESMLISIEEQRQLEREAELKREFPDLEAGFLEMDFSKTHTEPVDVNWDNYNLNRTFAQKWINAPMKFLFQLFLYALLLYTPAVVYTINYLSEAKSLPADFAMTLLGILFSTGNGVVGVMFYYIAEALPFKNYGAMRVFIMLSYTLLSLGNMCFSMYLIFGTMITDQARVNSDPNLRKDEQVTKNKIESSRGYSVGEETYLARQVFELLVPGTFLVPYITWVFVGYPLRRWLRTFNNFIPFADDVKSARVIELRVAEKFMEPPMMYVPWDYSANLILPLWSTGMFYLAVPQYQYRIFYNLFLFTLFMYFSQKFLHLGQSKMTYYSSGELSMWVFILWGFIISAFGGSIAWWKARVARFEALAVGEVVLKEINNSEQPLDNSGYYVFQTKAFGDGFSSVTTGDTAASEWFGNLGIGTGSSGSTSSSKTKKSSSSSTSKAKGSKESSDSKDSKKNSKARSRMLSKGNGSLWDGSSRSSSSTATVVENSIVKTVDQEGGRNKLLSYYMMFAGLGGDTLVSIGSNNTMDVHAISSSSSAVETPVEPFQDLSSCIKHLDIVDYDVAAFASPMRQDAEKTNTWKQLACEKYVKERGSDNSEYEVITDGDSDVKKFENVNAETLRTGSKVDSKPTGLLQTVRQSQGRGMTRSKRKDLWNRRPSPSLLDSLGSRRLSSSPDNVVSIHFSLIDTMMKRVEKDLELYSFGALVRVVLLYASVTYLVWLFVLRFVVNIGNIDHADQKTEENPITFPEVEKRYGFTYQNTNPIMVLRSNFLAPPSMHKTLGHRRSIFHNPGVSKFRSTLKEPPRPDEIGLQKNQSANMSLKNASSGFGIMNQNSETEAGPSATNAQGTKNPKGTVAISGDVENISANIPAKGSPGNFLIPGNVPDLKDIDRNVSASRIIMPRASAANLMPGSGLGLNSPLGGVATPIGSASGGVLPSPMGSLYKGASLGGKLGTAHNSTGAGLLAIPAAPESMQGGGLEAMQPSPRSQFYSQFGPGIGANQSQFEMFKTQSLHTTPQYHSDRLVLFAAGKQYLLPHFDKQYDLLADRHEFLQHMYEYGNELFSNIGNLQGHIHGHIGHIGGHIGHIGGQIGGHIGKIGGHFKKFGRGRLAEHNGDDADEALNSARSADSNEDDAVGELHCDESNEPPAWRQERDGRDTLQYGQRGAHQLSGDYEIAGVQ